MAGIYNIRFRKCKLCGKLLPSLENINHKYIWDNEYCSKLCYTSDQKLPIPDYSLRFSRKAYDSVIEAEQMDIFKKVNLDEEEEDELNEDLGVDISE